MHLAEKVSTRQFKISQITLNIVHSTGDIWLMNDLVSPVIYFLESCTIELVFTMLVYCQVW